MNRQAALATLALVLLAVFVTAFALINYNNSVKVWPLMTYHPLTLVIGISFALGAIVSGLLVSLLHHQRMLAATPNEPDIVPPASEQKRPHAGRI